MHSYKREVGELLKYRRGEGDVTMEAEIGVMRPKAKECQQLPEAERGKEWILS